MSVMQLPREIVKWLQSLDLSKTIVNPKRDLTNGFLIAEIMQRYFPEEIEMYTYENGSRLATKNDNWEQLYALCKKKGIPLQKGDFDTVIHCQPGAAIALLLKFYQMLTKREIRGRPPNTSKMLPPFARPTASWRLKDNEIHRVVNDIERVYRAIEALDIHNEQLGRDRSEEASRLFHMQGADTSKSMVEEMPEEKPDIKQVTVKTLGNIPQTVEEKPEVQKTGIRRKSCAAALAQLNPQQGQKLAADILQKFIKPLMDSEPEYLKGLDPRKDAFTSFMEQCLSGQIPEFLALELFSTIQQRALLLVEPLHKSPGEFHNVWSSLVAGLQQFSEMSELFDALVAMCMRLGELMRSQDSGLTAQLFHDVQVGELAGLLASSPGKRQPIAEIISAFLPQTPVAHVILLRGLKEHLRDLEPYCLALASMVDVQAQLGILDSSLLDLHVYYAMIALHNAQPKVRVAGVAMLTALAEAGHVQPVWPLIPDLVELTADPWWEVQAQVLMLTSTLLLATKMGGFEDPDSLDQAEQLLMVVTKVFNLQASKHILMVGLSALARNLVDYPNLALTYMSVLLAHPPAMRARLFATSNEQARKKPPRIAYVMGTSSRLYRENYVNVGMGGRPWPALILARALASHIDTMGLDHLEKVHAELLLTCTSTEVNTDGYAFPGPEFDEWSTVFDSLKKFIIVAMVDPELHEEACTILRRFWLNANPQFGEATFRASVDTILDVLDLLYGGLDREKVPESKIITFFEELRDADVEYAAVVLKQVVHTYREKNPSEYTHSSLASLF